VFCEVRAAMSVKTGGVKPRSTPQSAWRLSLPEREEISRGLLAGDSCRVIARRLGRSPSTVSRDVAATGHRERYRAWHADETAHRCAHRPKIAKLIAVPRLRRAVEPAPTDPRSLPARASTRYNGRREYQ